MRFLMVTLAAPLAVLLLAMQAIAAEVDRRDPAATATAFLEAYAAKDVVAMAPLSNETNRETFMALAEQGEEHEAYGEIFGGWRLEAAKAWQGTVATVRYSVKGNALVPFHEVDGDVAVIVLTRENGIWGIEDINKWDKASFEARPTAPPE